ncbi:hypothetical protein BDF14DRAFT_1839693, partial [Spinellus fusiger]
MLDNSHQHSSLYEQLMAPETLNKARDILVCRDKEVSISFYFTAPEHPRIAYKVFKRTIVVLSSEDKWMYVPVLNEPEKIQPIILQLSGMHFYLVKFKIKKRVLDRVNIFHVFFLATLNFAEKTCTKITLCSTFDFF